MKRLLCMTPVIVLFTLFSGCGEDPNDQQEKKPLEVIKTIPEDGVSVPGNMLIQVSFNNRIKWAKIVVTDAKGKTDIAGNTVSWTPSGDIPAGQHEMTIEAVDIFDQELGHFDPITFIAVEA